jgi:hypothetical protein
MAATSERDQLFMQVGRTLTAWNHIEEELLYLLEYAHSSDGIVGAELSVGYWAVVSFEARLKWCSAVVAFRTRFPAYGDLSSEWNALSNYLIEKARKRAEVAHGSVKSITDEKNRLVNCFVPYYHKRMMEFRFRAHDDQTSLERTLTPLALKDLQQREESFARLAKRIAKFNAAWEQRDRQTGYPG